MFVIVTQPQALILEMIQGATAELFTYPVPIRRGEWYYTSQDGFTPQPKDPKQAVLSVDLCNGLRVDVTAAIYWVPDKSVSGQAIGKGGWAPEWIFLKVYERTWVGQDSHDITCTTRMYECRLNDLPTRNEDPWNSERISFTEIPADVHCKRAA